MNELDFFISYSHHDEAVVKELVETLEKSGVKCWYAPRDVMGRYAKAIVDAIGRAKIFLLCLSSNAAVSDQVLNEVEMAYKRNRTSDGNILIEPLCIEPLDLDAPEFDEIMYYIRRINFISPQDLASGQSIAQEVLLKNESLLNIEGLNSKKERQKKEREESLYYTSEKEETRLDNQNHLTRKFDADIYNEVFNSYQDPNILDVGCSKGGLLIDRLSDYDGQYKLIGIDKDERLIEKANESYKNDHIRFLACDVEKSDFVDDLEDLMEEMDIDKFDIIHMSMLLLHLKSPTKLLRRLRRLLKTGGTIFIKDIDDGLNFAYPDDKNEFERIYGICDLDETAGERLSGRQIYHALYCAGFKDISLRRSGFSTIGLSPEERTDFWNMYFQFILDDIQWMHKKYPDNDEITKEYEWYSNNIEDIYNDFMQDDFAFSLGFQIYLAKK